MTRFLPLFAIALLACCTAMTPKAQGQPLVDAFIEAVNKRDEAAIKAFAAKWCSDAVPPEQRATRLLNFARQAAPLQFVKISVDKPGEIRVLLKDKDGEEIGAKFELVGGKMDRVLLGPPDMLEDRPIKDYSGYKELAELAESIRTDSGSPAMGIAVLIGGKLDQATAGVRSVGGAEKVGPEETWSIGSIGKSICSTAIGRLIEMGKLKFETTLGEAFPDVAMEEGYKSVTLDQIMHHRGGIPEDPGMNMATVQRIIAGEKEPTKIRANYAKDILSRDPIGKPGARFAYSNAGYALLSVIAERTMKKPYETLVHELVFEPLGLKHSYTGVDELPKDRPHGHVPGPKGPEMRDFEGPMEYMFAGAGGGEYMSLADLAKYGQAHLDGLKGKDGLLKATTIARLHSGVSEGGPEGRSYACGWGIETLPGLPVMHTHNGSNGTMRAQLSIFPELNLIVASFVNVGGEMEPSPPLQAVLAVAKKLKS